MKSRVRAARPGHQHQLLFWRKAWHWFQNCEPAQEPEQYERGNKESLTDWKQATSPNTGKETKENNVVH